MLFRGGHGDQPLSITGAVQADSGNQGLDGGTDRVRVVAFEVVGLQLLVSLRLLLDAQLIQGSTYRGLLLGATVHHQLQLRWIYRYLSVGRDQFELTRQGLRWCGLQHVDFEQRGRFPGRYFGQLSENGFNRCLLVRRSEDANLLGLLICVIGHAWNQIFQGLDSDLGIEPLVWVCLQDWLGWGRRLCRRGGGFGFRHRTNQQAVGSHFCCHVGDANLFGLCQSEGSAIRLQKLLDRGVDGSRWTLAQRKQDGHELEAPALVNLIQGDGRYEFGGKLAIEFHEDQRAIAPHQAEAFGK